MNIRETGLPPRYTRLLIEEGFETLESLNHISSAEVLRLPGFGRLGVKLLSEVMEKHGYHFEDNAHYALRNRFTFHIQQAQKAALRLKGSRFEPEIRQALFNLEAALDAEPKAEITEEWMKRDGIV